MSYALPTPIPVKLGIAKAGLGLSGIRARYYTVADVQTGAQKDNGITSEDGTGGEYTYYDAAVPDSARIVKFYELPGDTYLTKTSIEPAAAGGGGGGTVNVSVTPLTATIGSTALTNTVGDRHDLSVFQNEAITWSFAILDAAGAAYDLTGKDLQFVALDKNGNVVFSLETPTNVTISGTPTANVANVVTRSSDHASLARLDYRFWNLTDDKVLAHGGYKIVIAPQA